MWCRVTAAITPWNFPMSMITRKVSPALAVGCPVRIDNPTSCGSSGLMLELLWKCCIVPARKLPASASSILPVYLPLYS